MIKKVTAITALSAALLFGGGVHSTAHAAANDQSQNQINTTKCYYTVKTNQLDVNDFLTKYIANYNWSNPVKQEAAKQAAQQTQVQKPTTSAPAKQKAPSQTKQQTPTQKKTQAQYQLNQFEQQVVELTNKERAKYGLSPLKADWELSRVAREKSHDMAVNGYFSHNSPTYGSPFDMMKNWGISYRTAGENIAKGQRTPQEVVNAWMNSEGHRANILNKNFTHIGVGYVEQGNVWTQQFIGK